MKTWVYFTARSNCRAPAPPCSAYMGGGDGSACRVSAGILPPSFTGILLSRWRDWSSDKYLSQVVKEPIFVQGSVPATCRGHLSLPPAGLAELGKGLISPPSSKWLGFMASPAPRLWSEWSWAPLTQAPPSDAPFFVDHLAGPLCFPWGLC